MEDGKGGLTKADAETAETDRDRLTVAADAGDSSASVQPADDKPVGAHEAASAQADAPPAVVSPPASADAGASAEQADDAAAAYISEPKPRRAAAPVPEPGSSDFRGATTPDGILSTDSDDPFLRDIIAALKTVYDPEIPADIYELGLIYAVDVDDDRNVVVTMTLTAPGCPVAGEMPKWVENAVNAVPGVANTSVTMTFDPPWDMGRMSDEARLALNMF